MGTTAFVNAIRDNLGTSRTEAKAQALSWLAAQLRWEHTLDVLRAGDHEVPHAA